MEALVLIAIVALAYGAFRLNDRRHKDAAVQNISALGRELKAVTAMYMKDPNNACLLRLKEASDAEFWASVYFSRDKRYAKAEAEAELGLYSIQLAREALLFAKPEFRSLGTGCSRRRKS